MKTDEILKFIEEKDFLDKIYQFSYHRCNTSYEAEDLCSEIILSVFTSVQKQDSIENFHAFVWTIARRVYADFCEKQHRNFRAVSLENSEFQFASEENEIENFIEETAATADLKKIFTEIAFLSRAYREVMVMYYLDEMKIKDIAMQLRISETAVKQRLFSARSIVRTEVESMNNRNLSLKPVRMYFIGTGNPCGNDPARKAERMLSQNLIYLCKDKPQSAKELSEKLCVPMPYIEEELEIQCHGENGEYGMLRKLDNGKYTLNILLVDYSEYEQANGIYEKYLPDICSLLKQSVGECKDAILSCPYLSPQDSIPFILWTLIPHTFWGFEKDINTILRTKYFSDITESDRPFSSTAIAYETERGRDDFYGDDGITATETGGYRHVFISNLYGNRLDKHFGCSHNFAQDVKLLMVLRAIGGLAVNALTPDEEEIAAKCIADGYLRRQNNVLVPKIIVLGKENVSSFFTLFDRLQDNLQEIKEKIAAELSAFMKMHIPEHLMGDYPVYTHCIAGCRILSGVIEECIKEGILSEPENRLGGEGILMVVEK